jgi:hypothetical protein
MRTKKKKTKKKNLRVWLVGATLSEYPPMRSLEKKKQDISLSLNNHSKNNLRRMITAFLANKKKHAFP